MINRGETLFTARGGVTKSANLAPACRVISSRILKKGRIKIEWVATKMLK